MPSTGTTLFASSAVLVLVIGAGVGAQTTDVTERLENALEDVVDSALRDMAVNWLEVNDAHGQVDEDRVQEARLLVRLDGTVRSIDLDRVIARNETGQRLDLETGKALRDADGSLSNGTLNEGDLVELRLAFATGMDTDERRSVTLHHPNTAPLTFHMETPQAFGDSYVPLDVTRTR